MPRPKKSNKIVTKEVEETDELSPEKAKGKKSFDFEAAIEPVAIIDKVEETEVLVESEDGEDTGDGPELDDEEINPFKDKWEE